MNATIKIQFLNYLDNKTQSSTKKNQVRRQQSESKPKTVNVENSRKSNLIVYNRGKQENNISSSYSNCSIIKKDDFNPSKIDNTKYDKPILLINVYMNNCDTNYISMINLPKYKNNALFIYLSNENNSGYMGGTGGNTAMIGDQQNTFGIITGTLHKHSVNNIMFEAGGFNNLNDKTKFRLQHRGDKCIYIMTPQEAINFLLEQLNALIQKNKYEYLILPCELKDENKSKSTNRPQTYKDYTLGSGVFNTDESVKNYIYEKIVSMTKANETDGWQLTCYFNP